MKILKNIVSRNLKIVIGLALGILVVFAVMENNNMSKTQSLDKSDNKIIQADTSILASLETLSEPGIEGNDGQGYSLPDGKYYNYKLELYGKLPNAAQADCMIVLTNDSELTYEEAARSMYSSNSEDHRDFYLVSVETKGCQ